MYLGPGVANQILDNYFLHFYDNNKRVMLCYTRQKTPTQGSVIKEYSVVLKPQRAYITELRAFINQ